MRVSEIPSNLIRNLDRYEFGAIFSSPYWGIAIDMSLELQGNCNAIWSQVYFAMIPCGHTV
jgi:hypothetical protein